MNIQFSTSEPNEARRRIKRVEPDMPEERVERFVSAVRDGLIRVGDPMMYGEKAPIWPTEEGLKHDLASMLGVKPSTETATPATQDN